MPSICIENRNERITRLYEQGADALRIGRYVQRWQAWVKGGLHPYRLSAVGMEETCLCPAWGHGRVEPFMPVGVCGETS